MDLVRRAMRRTPHARQRAADRARAAAHALRERTTTLAHALSSGTLAAPMLGAGIEPAGARPAQPTDDARRMDWAATARAGTPHVRETHPDVDLPVLVVVDGRCAEWSATRELAAVTAGALVLAHGAAGHSVGWIEAGDGRLGLTPPRGDPRHAATVVESILAWATDPAGGRWGPATEAPFTGDRRLGPALGLARRTLGQRGAVFLVSDFRDEPPEAWIPDALALGRSHALIPVWIESPSAADLTDVGLVRVERRGRAATLDTARPGVRAALREEEDAWRARVSAALDRLRTRPIALRLGEAPGAAFLAHARANPTRTL